MQRGFLGRADCVFSLHTKLKVLQHTLNELNLFIKSDLPDYFDIAIFIFRLLAGRLFHTYFTIIIENYHFANTLSFIRTSNFELRLNMLNVLTMLNLHDIQYFNKSVLREHKVNYFDSVILETLYHLMALMVWKFFWNTYK